METPKIVRLTADFLDLDGGVGFQEGTILERSTNGSGQYCLPAATLGDDCVWAFKAIKDICEVIEI
jgi:hypothetical protein